MFRKPTPTEIKRIAETGAKVSYYCRVPFSTEKHAPSVKLIYFGGCQLEDIAFLDLLGLLAMETCADLNQVRLGGGDKHLWDKNRWAREIRKRI